LSALNDPAVVRREYADETGLSARIRAQQWATGPSPRDVLFEAVREAEPHRLLEVGPGRGEMAERFARELGAEVIGIDQSPRMVELTQARGVDAVVGDVCDLPFRDGVFDVVVAAWMLYHVPELGRALTEIRRVLRPGGTFVATTNSDYSLAELWELVGYVHQYSFGAENAEAALLRYFTVVRRRDVKGELTFPDRDAAHSYLAAGILTSHLADRLPPFAGPLVATRHVVVFVCEP
jgi:SAM-dependent methyltransferase